jgi:hypothetical protein
MKENFFSLVNFFMTKKYYLVVPGGLIGTTTWWIN